MKPYGQKKAKTKLGIHPSDKCHCEVCNTGGWKVLRSRERKPTDPELHLNYSNLQFEDIEQMVIVERYEDEDGEAFRAYCNSPKFEAIGVTPDHAINKAYRAFPNLMNEI